MNILNAHSYVPPLGLQDAKIVLVGEQPGKNEIYQRQPFVGPAGRELDSCLHSAGLTRSDCYLTNVIKDLDQHIDKYIKLKKDTAIISDSGKRYIDFLQEEITKISPNVIVAIGNIALYALTGLTAITKRRGSILESTLIPGTKVIPTIHPATILPPKFVYLNRHLIIFDLKRVKEESKTKDFNFIERNVKIEPSYHDAQMFLMRCESTLVSGAVVDYDIEVFNGEVSCISLAISPTEVMSIPFIDAQGDYFTIEQEATIWKDLARMMEDPKLWKRGQNIVFDSHFLLNKYGIKARSLHDTMVAQKILFPDYRVGLDFITTMYTDIPYYKDDGKHWYKTGGNFRKLWNYNALDSLACAIAHPKQMVDLERQGNLKTYERKRRIIEPLAYIMEKGILVDTVGMATEAARCDERIETLQEELNTIAGRELNPNSTTKLPQYLYEEKGYAPYRNKSGKYTTDETALKRLIRKGCREAEIVRDYRSEVKLRGNYFSLDKVDKDGRIRCSYNPVGTRFSRISSSKNIFGTGGNLQNWPHKAMKFLLADSGYVYYSYDLSQIENRIVAYVGNVTQMIDAFEADQDMHSLTAALLFNKPIEEISSEDGSSPLGGGKQSERFWGKKTNHELDYDMGYRTFSLQMELPESEGKWLVERWHHIYPGVRQGYHAYVKQQLGENRTLTNLFDRRTLFLDQWGDKLFKAAYSCIPQGTTGDKIDEQGMAYIYYNQDLFKPIELLIQIHDSIGFQIPTSIPWSQHADMLMNIKKSLETPLIWKGREFIVPVDLVMGFNLYKDEGIEIKHGKFPQTNEELAKELEKSYNKLKGEKLC